MTILGVGGEEARAIAKMLRGYAKSYDVLHRDIADDFRRAADLIDQLPAILSAESRARREGAQEMERIAQFLFALLDDIDTAGDRAKSDDRGYRLLVERLHRRRFQMATTDGQTVTFNTRALSTSPSPTPQQDAVREALRQAHHALTVSHGVTATDRPERAIGDPSVCWEIDNSKELDAIDAALARLSHPIPERGDGC